MRHLLTALLLALVCCPAAAQRRVSLDRNWHFFCGNGSAALTNLRASAFWRQIDLPHDWSIESEAAWLAGGTMVGPFSTNSVGKYQTGFTVGGEGWYRKELHVSRGHLLTGDARGGQKVAVANRRVSLYFEGAYNQADVYLNGEHLFFNPYGYSSFRVDLTNHLRPGRNTLLVRVRNVGQNTRWYAGSGLYRHVWLESTPLLHLDEWGTFIQTRSDTALIQTTVCNNSRRAAQCQVSADVLDAAGQLVATAHATLPLAPGQQQEVTLRAAIPHAKTWSPDTPYLYKAVLRVADGGKAAPDCLTKRFGVRTLQFTATDGFLLNGVPMLLRGGCVHHDNGLLGAAAYDAAEDRKLSLLKAQGYNAVRCSHNMPSEHFLDACDSLGLMVIDEAFDQWLRPKNRDDYHRYFAERCEQDLQTMVCRDRNHPCIIMWSIGNEIPGRIEPQGQQAAARMQQLVHRLDPTRPVTAAICGWDEGDAWNAAARNWQQQDDNAFRHLDVGGYNYLYDKYEHDHQTHPDRVMFGAESYPKQAAQNWDKVEQLPYVVGDFVWTAMDYLGEAGIGSASFHAEGGQSMFQPWPWYNGWCGDLDLIGQKKPQSYYRDVVWRRAPITMAVEQPAPSGTHMSVSAWGWQLENQDWWCPQPEGTPLRVNVYSRSPQVRLYLNDNLVGTQTTGATYCATFTVPYHPGTLRATTFTDGAEADSFTLCTAGQPAALRLTADRHVLTANGTDLAYITIELVDAQGRLVRHSDRAVSLSLSGEGTLLASGNASPTDMASFRNPAPALFEGRALAIVKSADVPGSLLLTATTAGLPSQTITITTE